MSLHALAGHMSAKGRGPDSMLVHMSPREVASLQALAVKNGTSLTINPDTGLPEALKLKDILPALAGVALGPAGFGLMSGTMAGLTVGGITTLATGSLSRGLMAGMGAYGASGLAEGLMGAGAGAAQNAAMSGLTQEQIAAQIAEKGLTEQGVLNQAAADATNKYASSGFGDRLTQGASAAMDNPKGFVQGMGGVGKTAQMGLAAISPIVADQGVQTATPRQAATPAYIRKYRHDPYTGASTFQGMYEASKDKGMAQGGIVALAAGGTPGSVEELYQKYAGRGSDPEGLAFWTKSFGDTIDPSEIHAFQYAVAEARAKGTEPAAQAAPQPTYAPAPQPTYAPAPQPTYEPAPQPAAYSAPVAQAQPLTVEQLYRDYAGRGSDPEGLAFWTKAFGDQIDENEITSFQNAVAAARAKGTEPGDVTQTQANALVQDMYRNVLNRDAEQSGLNYWSDLIQGTNDPNKVYNDFVAAAKSNTELGNFGLGFEQATTPFAGYKSADTGSNADEWVRNVLGREVTDADRNQQWYKDMAGVTQVDEAKAAYRDFLASTGAKTDLDWMAASQLSPLKTTPKTSAPEGTTNPYGNAVTPGDQTLNPNGSITVQPNIPGRPYGGFTGIQQLKDAYTQGGGSLGYVNPAPKSINEFNQRFNKQTGSAKSAYDYLMGKGAYPTNSSTTEIMRPYSESALRIAPEAGRPNQQYIYDSVSKNYKKNPDFIPVTYDSEGRRVAGVSDNQLLEKLKTAPQGAAGKASGGSVGYADGGAAQESVNEATKKLNEFLKKNSVSHERIASLLGISVADAKKRYPAADASEPFDMNQVYGGDGAGGFAAPGASGAVGDANSITGGAFAAAMDALGLSQDPSNVGVVSFGETGFGPSAEQGFSVADSVGSEGLGSGNLGAAADNGLAAEGGNTAAGAAAGAADAAGAGAGGIGAGNDGGGIGAGEGLARGGAAHMALGGLGALARGGQAGYNLGGYSDGGRLLRGPGDGVSDSIPATIGNRQPARLADGEFVIPARIVSELGNGSTEAGARKLYAMMDRVQKARRKTTGKNRVAANTRSDKYLPA